MEALSVNAINKARTVRTRPLMEDFLINSEVKGLPYGRLK
jgi:hypothetical protein